MILRNGKRIDGCSDTVPIGSLNPFLGATAPYGYLICEGQLVSKTTYPELYAICGDTYGTATATEFYLPDLRGRTIVGYKEGDINFGTLGGLVGAITTVTGNHTLTADESGLPSHVHLVRNNYGYIDTTSNSGTGSWGQKFNPSSSGGTAVSSNFWKAIESTAQTAISAHNHGDVSTIQPSINLNYIVKAFMLMPNQSYVATTEQESNVNTYSCDYINDKLKWKLLIADADSSTNVNLPNDFNEIYAEVHLYNGASEPTTTYISTVIPKQVFETIQGTNYRYHRLGAYYNTSTNYGCVFKLYKDYLIMTDVYSGSAMKTQYSKMNVYYR